MLHSSKQMSINSVGGHGGALTARFFIKLVIFKQL